MIDTLMASSHLHPLSGNIFDSKDKITIKNQNKTKNKIKWNNHTHFLSTVLFLFHETTTLYPICDAPLPHCNHRHLEEKKKITFCLSLVMPLWLTVFVGHFGFSSFNMSFVNKKLKWKRKTMDWNSSLKEIGARSLAQWW